MRKPLRNRDPRGNVHGFEHRQSELGVVTLLVGRVAEPMYVKIGEDAQERRTHVDPAPLAQVGETIEIEEILRLHDCLLGQIGGPRELHAVHFLGTDPRIVIKLSGRR